MFEREKRVLARHYLDEGMSRAEAARRVGIGRRTLYNWIADGLLEGRLGDQKDGYGPRPPRASKLGEGLSVAVVAGPRWLCERGR